MSKAKRMPIGTVSRGYKKIAEGKWVRVKKGRKPGKPEDPEKVRGSKSGYGIQNIQVGDEVKFRSGGKVFEGHIMAMGEDGAIIRSNVGDKKVLWKDIRKLPVKTPKPVQGDKKFVIEKIPPEKFNAFSIYEKYNDPDITEEDIIKAAQEDYPDIDVMQMIKTAQDRLKSIEETYEKHRLSGQGETSVYTPERAKKHAKILSDIFTPEALMKAKPKKGEPPLGIFLGGRGGSGKGGLKNIVYDPERTIVLDCDKIKDQLDEYAGWNAYQVHEESSDILEKAFYIARTNGLNLVVDATLRKPSAAMEKVTALKKLGYRMECHYVHLPRQTAAKRALNRFLGKEGKGDGRFVPPKVILGNTDNEDSFELLKGHMSAWSFFDNQGDPPPKLVSRSGKGLQSVLKSVRTVMKSKGSAERNDPHDAYDFRHSDGGPVAPDTEKLTRVIGKRIKKLERKRVKLEKAFDRFRLVRKQVMVTRGGKSFPSHVWVRPGDEDKPVKRVEILNPVKDLGGSTGAQQIRLPNGKKGVLKHGDSDEHIIEEFTANKVYGILGVPVQKVRLTNTPRGAAQVAEWVDGETMDKFRGTPEFDKIVQSLRGGFVADALLGNWDVLGMHYDNIVWDGTTAHRIDNGGSMRFRAQGGEKGSAFGGHVGELESMRDPERGAGRRAFSIVTDSEVRKQIQMVLRRRLAILAAMPDPEIREVMSKRIDSLERYLGKTPKKSLYGVTDKDAIELLSNYTRRPLGEGHEREIPTEADLEIILKESIVCFISAGRNPNDPDDMKMTDEQIQDRHEKLIDDLMDRGYVFTRCEGKYGHPEESLMVIAHDAETEEMLELGSKYKQDSVLISEYGNGKLIYTTGEKKGKSDMSGEGYEAVPDADDFYSRVHFADGTTFKFTMNLSDTVLKGIREYALTLIKNRGKWYAYDLTGIYSLVWAKGYGGIRPLQKSKNVLRKAGPGYYGPEEIKAQGMRWVTIRGSKVLLKPLKSGGYAVVGGAGGRLNHLKVDRIGTKEEYAAKRKELEENKREKLDQLSKEDVAKQIAAKKAERAAKKVAKEAYISKVSGIVGKTTEEFRAEIASERMGELEQKARDIVTSRKNKPSTPEKIEAEIDRQKVIELEREVVNEIKNAERQAMQVLMADYLGDDPNAKGDLKSLLDPEKAKEILAARKEYRKELKAIGTVTADVRTDLRVGGVMAGSTRSTAAEIEQEIREHIETQKNIALYDAVNEQSDSIHEFMNQGATSAINGLIGDIYGTGAVFSTDAIDSLGTDGVVKLVAMKIRQDGDAEAVKNALDKYAAGEREKVVTEALDEFQRRKGTAKEIRDLARDSEDAEAILTMASANGHALKQVVAGQRALGTAVGSLRAVAHMLNTLDDPPTDTVQIDMGTDLIKARKQMRKAGLFRGDYTMRTKTVEGKKRFVAEIKPGNINRFFDSNKRLLSEADEMARIKTHEANDGYKPPGIKDTIRLDPAQEAGLRFFKAQKRVLLDFEAGLGKTAVGYAAAMEAMNNFGAKKVLIVTPAKLRGQMYDERKVFLTPEMQEKVNLTNERTAKAKRLEMYGDDGIMIIGHDQLRTDSKTIKEAGFDMVIIDEIHELTAGQGKAGRYKGMMHLKDIPYKIGMSGTNIKNKKEELYRKVNFIDPEHTLGSMADFNKRYKGLNQGTGIFADAANDAFRKEVSKWSYTQKNALPVKNDVERVTIPLSKEQRKKYAESERIYRDEREQGIIGAAARRDSRNYEIVANSDSEDNMKLSTIVDTMRNSHPEEKAVIHVYGLKAMETARKRLEAEFGPGSVGLIHGSSRPGEVSKLKKQFNDPSSPLKFILGTKSLEAGHNLQHGGTVTFHLDIPESYAAFNQRNARVFRKGQTKDTKTYVLSGTNPYDIRQEDLMDTKRKEMQILGNPREVERLDASGFLTLLNQYEAEGASARA